MTQTRHVQVQDADYVAGHHATITPMRFLFRLVPLCLLVLLSSTRVVAQSADLRVTLQGFPATGTAGSSFNGQYVLSNLGPQDASGTITLAVAVQNGTLTGLSGGFFGNVVLQDAQNGTVTYTFFNFGLDETNSVSVRASDSGGDVTITSTVTYGGDGNTSNNSATSVIAIPAVSNPGSISGIVIDDYDDDGTMDLGEPGLQGITVTLSNGDQAVTTTGGVFTFPGLDPGTYTVGPVLSDGTTFTAPVSGVLEVIVVAGETTSGLEFLVDYSGLISGTVSLKRTADGTPERRAGIPVFLDLNNDGVRGPSEPADTTDADGLFAIVNTVSGTVTLRHELASSTRYLDPPSGSYDVQVGPGLDVQRAFVDRVSGSIQGLVYEDMAQDSLRTEPEDIALSSFGVSVGDELVETDGTGMFAADGLWEGSYVIDVGEPGDWVATQRPAAVSVEAGSPEDTEVVLGAFERAVLAGNVYSDDNVNGVRDLFEPSLPDVVVRCAGAGCPIDSDLTGADGTFSFSGLEAGNHTITAQIPAGYVAISQPTTLYYELNLSSGQRADELQFGMVPEQEEPAPTGIAGTVWDDVDLDGFITDGELNVSGVTVYLDLNRDGDLDLEEPTTQTDSLGQYLFEFLDPGEFWVDLDLSDRSDLIRSKPNGHILVEVHAGEVVSGQDFSVLFFGAISGWVWFDTDHDGVRDAEEAAYPLPITVRDSSPEAEVFETVIPDDRGYWQTVVEPGDYILGFVAEGKDCCWDFTTFSGADTTVTVASGQVVDEVNFGIGDRSAVRIVITSKEGVTADQVTAEASQNIPQIDDVQTTRTLSATELDFQLQPLYPQRAQPVTLTLPPSATTRLVPRNDGNVNCKPSGVLDDGRVALFVAYPLPEVVPVCRAWAVPAGRTRTVTGAGELFTALTEQADIVAFFLLFGSDRTDTLKVSNPLPPQPEGSIMTVAATSPGKRASAMVLDGSDCAAPCSGLVLRRGTSVDGLSIVGFPDDGIVIDGDSVVVGSADISGNGGYGIRVTSGATHTLDDVTVFDNALGGLSGWPGPPAPTEVSLAADGMTFMATLNGYAGSSGLLDIYACSEGGAMQALLGRYPVLLDSTGSAIYSDTLSVSATAISALFSTPSGGSSLPTDCEVMAVSVERESQTPESVITVYPNPTTGPVRMDVDLEHPSPYRAVIVDVQGRIVAVVSEGHAPSGPFQLSFSGRLNPGAYFFRLTGPGVRITKPFVVVR